jgi:hypothetical protein
MLHRAVPGLSVVACVATPGERDTSTESKARFYTNFLIGLDKFKLPKMLSMLFFNGMISHSSLTYCVDRIPIKKEETVSQCMFCVVVLNCWTSHTVGG